MTLEFAQESATGQRADNQDRVLQFDSPFGSLFVLADGMGGHQGGARASSLATAGCRDTINSLPESLSPEIALVKSIQSVNRTIAQESQNGDPASRKMGSTIVALLISETQNGLLAIAGHVGDSRLYFARDNNLFQLTEDHTIVQRLLKNNTLTEEQAKDHPQAGVLTRALGQREEVEVDLTQWMLLQAGDTFLLCSDGLSGFVSDESIKTTLLAPESCPVLAQRLIELAFNQGSDDNVSVQVVRVAPAK